MDEELHYSNALCDLTEAYRAFEPPLARSVAEGAAKSLVIKQTGAPSGPWSAEETPYMVEPMNMLASRLHEAEVFVGPARTGKCLDVNTQIPVPSGWKKMGDLLEGDEVFGTDGNPITVLAAHDVKYGLPCFDVRLSDGSNLIADSEHLWGVERFYWNEPHWRYEVKTTRELTADLTYSPRKDGGSRFRYRIRNAAPISCRTTGLYIDPYLLGVWLGNGSAGAASVCSHNDDVSHYETAARTAGHTASSIPDGPNTSTTRFDLLSTNPNDPLGTLSQRLKTMGLMNNKHIPDEYLRASADQRVALLRGLMDTDGYPGDKNRPAVEFSTVSERMCGQFLELARSLGLKPIAKKKETTWTHNGERKFGSAYRITFSVPDGFEVFTLPRKRSAGRCASIDVGYRQIVSITQVESRPVRCIQVDSKDSLFLAGEGFIPTHNTVGLLLGWMAHTIVNDPGDMLFIQMTQDKAREFSKTDVSRAINNSPDIAAMLSVSASDRNTHDVMFRNGAWLRIAWPTVSNVSGSTYRYVAITDYDRIANADDVDGEGPLFALARKRTTTFLSRGMCLVESSPGVDVTDPAWKPATMHEAPPVKGVLGIYNGSDRRRWYWQCPDCRDWFEAAPGLALFHLPADDTLIETVRTMDLAAVAKKYGRRIVCPCCGVEIPYKRKTELNNNGRWVPDGQRLMPDGALVGTEPTSKVAGYWLGGVAAAYQSWESLVYRHLQGLLDYALTGSEKSLQTTVNTDQGAPYVSRHLLEARAGGKTPHDRAEAGMQRYVVPEQTRCVIAAVDVQGGVNSRFVVQVHAVGPNMEQWLVDRFEIKHSKRQGMGSEFAPIDPASHPEDWQLLTDKLLLATWKTPDPGIEIKAKRVVVDSGGEDGVTENAYAWFRQVRKLGMAGRVRLYKGASTKGAPIIKESLVGSPKGKGDVPLLHCNPNLLSDAVAAGLKRQEGGAGYIHFPKPRHPTLNPDGWLPASFFDELEAEVRAANGTWQQIRKRNESFDLCRMVRAGLLSLAVDKIKDWNAVPAWLAPLDQNSEVVSVDDRRAMKENEFIAPVPDPVVRVVAQPRRQRRHAYANI